MADFAVGLGKVINNPIFRSAPGLGAGTTAIQKLINKQAASIITGKAEEGLGEFTIAQAIKQIDAPPLFYGGYIGGGFASTHDPLAAFLKQSAQGGQ
jgi:hypothetical protein